MEATTPLMSLFRQRNTKVALALRPGERLGVPRYGCVLVGRYESTAVETVVFDEEPESCNFAFKLARDEP